MSRPSSCTRCFRGATTSVVDQVQRFNVCSSCCLGETTTDHGFSRVRRWRLPSSRSGTCSSGPPVGLRAAGGVDDQQPGGDQKTMLHRQSHIVSINPYAGDQRRRPGHQRSSPGWARFQAAGSKHAGTGPGVSPEIAVNRSAPPEDQRPGVGSTARRALVELRRTAEAGKRVWPWAQ